MNTESLDDLLALAAQQKTVLEAENECLRAELAAHIAWAQRAYAYFRDSITLGDAGNWEEINRLGGLRFDLEATAPAAVRQPASGEATGAGGVGEQG